MLTPIPAVPRSLLLDSSTSSTTSSTSPSQFDLIPALPSTPSATSPQLHSHYRSSFRNKPTPAARSSKLSRASPLQHHRHRPSKQFVATTSSTIFGDWDLDIKIAHRTKGAHAVITAGGGRSGGESGGVRGGGSGGGGGGVSGNNSGRGVSSASSSNYTIGPGPGINTGVLGTQPLSTLPTSPPRSSVSSPIKGNTINPKTSSSIPNSHTQQAAHNAALNILKGQRFNLTNNSVSKMALPKGSNLSTASTISQQQKQQKSNNNNNSNNSNVSNPGPRAITTASVISASPAHKAPTLPQQQQSQQRKQKLQQQQQPPEQKEQHRASVEESQNSVAGTTTTTTTSSAKSGFLRALGKFKNKHMQQKRSSAPPAAHETIDQPSAYVDENRRASYILPPMRFGETEVAGTSSTGTPAPASVAQPTDNNNNNNSKDLHSSALPSRPQQQSTSHLQTSRQAQAQPHSGADKDNSPTFSVPGTTPPSPSGSSRMTESMEMSVDNSADTTPSSSIQGDPVLDRVSNPSSSLRIKFKNRVHNTLASMKSSSNLRDRAKAERQAAAVGEGADTDATAPSRRFLLGDRRLSAQASLPSQDQEPKSTTATPALNATTPPTIKKKTSRTFWTFPRGKLDTSLAATSGAGSSSKQSSGWEETATKDDDITMISPDHGPGEGPSPFSSVFHRQQCQQQEQGAVDEASKKEAVSDDFDSDNSIDIIQPADYQDYTQFAEFPLKKRKKMERSLAATLAAETASQGSKRPNSMRASADAMRRFLLLQQQQQKDEVDLSQEVEGPNNSNNNKSNDKKKKNKNKKNKGKSTEAQEDTIEVLSREMGPPTGTMIIKSNKRPQLSTSTTESTDQIHKRPSTTNPGGGGASDWRRSFLRSLHLGRRNQRSKGNAIVEQDDDDDEPMTGEATSSSAKRINTTASTTTTVMGPPAVPDRDGPYPRASRSGSVRSIRSRSLLTSSHPALYATTTTTMTGSSSPRSPGMRRETLEMAIRRRRQSSAARSHINHTDIPSSMPLSSEFFGLDNNSAMNVTHTFTSFTFELADMYAHDVVNNSVTPGLFNWKYGPPAAAAAVAALVQQHRRPTQSSISRRVTVSSNVMDVDTDQEFKGFDSDGDAISGYTGDADISMEEIYVRPKTPSAPGPRPGSAMNHHRRETSEMRRRLSSIDGDSDTISELPTLLIRTRELNRSSGGSAAVASGPSTSSTSRTARPPAGFLESIDNDTGRTSPRSPTRRGANSPTLIRKTARLPSSTSSAVAKAAPLSMEEVVSWKPRNAAGVAAGPLGSSPTRPLVPALDTSRSAKSSPKRDGSGGLSSSTTLIPSASTRTPSSAASSGSQVLTASPTDDRFSLRQQHLHQHHASNSGSSQSHFRYPSAATQSSSDRHSHHPSADTLVSSSHLKNFSSASNASTLGGHGAAGSSSGVGGGHHAIATAMAAMQAEEERQRLFLVQKRGSGSSAGGGNGVQEFDPSDFPPTTPVDLKAMDFETLLATAEREHLLGWEGLKKEKKGGFSSLNRASVSPAPGPVINNNKSTSPVKEGVQSHANMQPLKIVTHHGPTGLVNPSNATTKRPFIVQHQPTQQQQQQPRVTVAFDLSPSDDGEGSGFGGTGTGTGTGTGSDRSSRSKRVMKKKMSVIRLTGGNIQGRREDDGVIRVTKTSVSPGSPPHSPPQQPQQSLSSSGFSATGRYHSQHQQQQQQRDWH